MSSPAQWVVNANLLWSKRRMLLRVAAWATVLSLAVALLIPNQYESTTRIMPPDQPGGGGAAALAALLHSSSGNLAGLASSLGGVRSSGSLFIDLLESRTIREHIIDRFQLQKLYHKRYLISTIDKLASRTSVSDDKKSGIITITVTDTDRHRACEMTQAYLDELNELVARTNTSAAHLERVFIEQRLVGVQAELEQAQIDLSNFSSANTAIDIKEQTRAMVDAGAKLQGELIAAQSELDSTEQIYGEENVHVRAAHARVANLQSELNKMSGTDASLAEPEPPSPDHPYPSLRQLPKLGVRWADLYRHVRVMETVFEILSTQQETARIEEARSLPTVKVVDEPSWPEKKSFPPRLLIVLACMVFSVAGACVYLLLLQSWESVDADDPRKQLVLTIYSSVRRRIPLSRRVDA